MKQRMLCILILAAFAACRRADTCGTNGPPVEGRIVSISGPERMKKGTTATLVVTVLNDDRYCVQYADCFVAGITQDTVHIAATLMQTGHADRNHCGCKTEREIKTLCYFTPGEAGNYLFSFGRDGVGSGLPWDDAYGIIVQ